MKALFVCNSVYQVMVAVQLRLRFMKDDDVDIIISDHLTNSLNIAKRLKETGVFRKVTHICNRKYVLKQGASFSSLCRTIIRTRETIKNQHIIKALLHDDPQYDTLYISNISIFTILLYHRLQKKNCTLNIFEDGFATYCNSFRKSDGASFISRRLVKEGLLGNASKLYLFNPDLLEWHFQGEVIPIPKFSSEDVQLKDILNIAFSYADADDYTSKPYLFMEESFFADGYKVNDIELVEAMACKVGWQNIMIKLHPRNPINRWTERKVSTNRNIAIPWELILLNQKIDNLTIVTISSSSALTPYLLFGSQVKTISLLPLLTCKPGAMAGDLGRFMQKIYSMYPQFLAPKSIAQFLKLL